ncbi:hypothetical protein IIB79_12370 [candidate division KSB1 bacterium]|nr:hypothetical protein [candidate division KSB1 bacterium]
MIIKTITVSPFAENCYIVASEKTLRGVVIDPGDEVDRIIAEMKRARVDLEREI